MKNNLVYDVGMYDGADTRNYLSKGYNVVAVEADPTLVDKASKNFSKYIKSGRLKIINAGIAEKKGKSFFYINDAKPIWNSFNAEKTGRDNLPYRKIEIPCVQFEDILAEYGVPYYLKIDIEGNDIFCLKGLKAGSIPKYISCEADNQGNTEMLFILKDLGYKKFQCINQNTFLPITVPYKSFREYDIMNKRDRIFLKVMYNKHIAIRILRKLKGRQIFKLLLNPSPHLTYPISTSGPFGEYLTGQWHNFDEMKSLYIESFKSYLNQYPNSDYGFYCDFHASF